MSIETLKQAITSEVIEPMEAIKEAEKALKDNAAGEGLEYAELKKAAKAEHDGKEGAERAKAQILIEYLDG
jgi:hypothetical protein